MLNNNYFKNMLLNLLNSFLNLLHKKRTDILKEVLKNVSYYFSLLFNILRLDLEKKRTQKRKTEWLIKMTI